MQEVAIHADLYSDSEESGCESEEQTDDEDEDVDADDETMADDGYDDVTEDRDVDTDDALERPSNGTGSESGNNGDDDLCHDKARSCTLIIGGSRNLVLIQMPKMNLFFFEYYGVNLKL